MLSPRSLPLFRAMASHPVPQALLAGLLAMLLYLNDIHSTFIFDDWEYIVENPLIKDFKYFLHLGNLQQYVTEHGIVLSNIDLIYNFVLRPVSYLTFALNYKLHGIDTTGYNVVNILFHVAASMLAYLFTYLIVRQLRLSAGEEERPSWIPLMVALLFACHPIQAQAVSYIVQRFASIAACCYLLALSAYMISRRSRSQAATALWYSLALAATVTGMLSKENVFTLTVMIAVTEFLCFRETFRKRALLLVPFLATMAIIPLTIMGLTGQTTSLHANVQLINFQKTPHLTYIFTEFRVLLTYLRLLVLPMRQQLDYDYPLYDSLIAPPVIASLLFLLVLAAGGAYSLYQGRKIGRSRLSLAGFGILWFFVTLAVESGLVPTDDVIFEHRLYLPCAGFFIAVSAIAEQLYRSMKSRPVWRMVARAALVSVIIVLSIATFRRNLLWSDTLAFWQDNAAKSPNKPRVQQCLGDTYMRSGKPREAIAAYEKFPLTQATPQHVFINLADAYFRLGEFDKGVRMSYKAIAHNPYDFIPYSNLGMKYAIRGDFDAALELLNTAIRLNRNDLLLRQARAEIYIQQGKVAKALSEYEDILRLSPNDPQAVMELERLRQ